MLPSLAALRPCPLGAKRPDAGASQREAKRGKTQKQPADSARSRHFLLASDQFSSLWTNRNVAVLSRRFPSMTCDNGFKILTSLGVDFFTQVRCPPGPAGCAPGRFSGSPSDGTPPSALLTAVKVLREQNPVSLETPLVVLNAIPGAICASDVQQIKNSYAAEVVETNLQGWIEWMQLYFKPGGSRYRENQIVLLYMNLPACADVEGLEAAIDRFCDFATRQ